MGCCCSGTVDVNGIVDSAIIACCLGDGGTCDGAVDAVTVVLVSTSIGTETDAGANIDDGFGRNVAGTTVVECCLPSTAFRGLPLGLLAGGGDIEAN